MTREHYDIYAKTFDEVISDFMPLIHSTIDRLGLSGKRDEYEHIGMLALFDAWQRFDGDKGAFPSYARLYIHGRMCNYLRDQDKWSHHNHLTDHSSIAESAPAVEDDALKVLELFDYGVSMNLTPRELCWYEGAIIRGDSVADLADHYKVSKETVKSWRKGAIRKLRMANRVESMG
ncbi:sigma-70 family RNA polymerase sigma factor [Salisediminibacterium beveridgei]|uniref:RNA polymerase sigma factor SigS n=1 Tax=Salisediminibacterium beveridgei TaxID=632773 RepID=A0A1D7QRM7_9BACI|nr:sigma-70 family RNA polymerase sigma factor [Salisediminibacterium beveridgei]AOM81649.1 RNA Polymerase Sigma-70 factor [Salisediminibacterium beveridgei]